MEQGATESYKWAVSICHHIPGNSSYSHHHLTHLQLSSADEFLQIIDDYSS